MVLLFVSIISYLPRSEERLHFFTFGLFGFLSKRLLPTWLAIVSIITWSGGDELFQAWLPDRVGDWRDVGMNVVASIIGISIALIGSNNLLFKRLLMSTVLISKIKLLIKSDR
jgi:VanZ family protein